MRITISIIIFCCSFSIVSAQQINLNQAIVAVSFEQEPLNKTKKKKPFTFTKKNAAYNPLNYLVAGLLFSYQHILSEQIQASCMYETSCSEYTRLSIHEFGLLPGMLNGLNQWSECFAGALYEHPPVFRNKDNKIINDLEDAGR